MPRYNRTTFPACFWSRAHIGESNQCWPWKKPQSTGYGQFWIDGKPIGAHRVAYELSKGTIPEGLQIDHLFRNRACINPAHLEPVTCQVNLLRGETKAAYNAAKTHCKRGHAFSEHGQPQKRGKECRTCRNLRRRVKRQFLKSQAAKEMLERLP